MNEYRYTTIMKHTSFWEKSITDYLQICFFSVTFIFNLYNYQKKFLLNKKIQPCITYKLFTCDLHQNKIYKMVHALMN